MGYERELSARQKALDLAKRKEAIETEMDVIYETLTANDGPGLQGNLVDSQGFPRADIDIVKVRQQRNRFAHLKTDHKTLSAELDRLMQIALAPQPENSPSETPTLSQSAAAATSATSTAEHAQVGTASGPTDKEAEAATQQQSETTSAVSSASAQQQQQQQDIRQAFALVDIVSPASPSEAAGLLVNDRILAFGAVSLRSSPTPRDAMAALPGLLRSHENRELDVIVRRGEGPSANVLTLSLTPRQWQGQGLLGCHVVPLEATQMDPRYMPDVATAAALRANTTGRLG